MNWRFIMLMITLVAGLMAAWFGDQYLQDRILFVRTPEDFIEENFGWGILLSLWPLTIIIGLIMGSIFTIVLMFFFWKADDSDQTELIAKYEKTAEIAKNQRDIAIEDKKSAQTEARNKLDKEWLKLQKEQYELQNKLQELEVFKSNVQKKVIKLQSEDKKTKSELALSQRKRDNAAAAFKRKAKKLEKIEAMQKA